MVEVEHIDGDWENNSLTNLTLLCPNCHALTPTFRGLNRGRGRSYRLAEGAKTENWEGEERYLIQEASVPLSIQLELLLPT